MIILKSTKILLVACVLSICLSSCESDEYPKVYTFSHIEAGEQLHVVIRDDILNPEIEDYNGPLLKTQSEIIDLVQEFYDVPGINYFETIEIISDNEVKFTFENLNQIQESIFSYSAISTHIIFDNIGLVVKRPLNNFDELRFIMEITRASPLDISQVTDFSIYQEGVQEATSYGLWSTYQQAIMDSIYMAGDTLAVYRPELVYTIQ